MSNVAVSYQSLFANVQLPPVTDLAVVPQNLAASLDANSVVLLKMDRLTGEWSFGQEATPIEENSTWAVNPFSFLHGFIAWRAKEVVGEVMVPATQPLPEPGEVPAGTKLGWQHQISMSLKCLNGDDKDLELRYGTSSKGGIRAVHGLSMELSAQISLDKSRPIPVIKLRSSSYEHKEFGRTWTPSFEVVGWMGMDGETSAPNKAEPVLEHEPIEEVTPIRRRRG